MYKMLSLCLFLSFLSGCLWTENQKLSSLGGLSVIENNSSFRVDEVKGNGYINYKKGFPVSFILNLNACIKDSIKKDTPLQDVRFNIEYRQKGQAKPLLNQVQSDQNGCIKWSEEYPYKYVFKPYWVGLDRTISGAKKSAYQGNVPVRLAVNPWIFETKENFPDIMDLRSHYYNKNVQDILNKGSSYIEKGLEFLLDKKKIEYLQLWAPNIRLQLELKENQKAKAIKIEDLIKKYSTPCGSEKENCYARKLKMTLLIPLELRMLGVKGQILDRKVSSGNYSLKAHLVAQYPKSSNNYYRLHEKILRSGNLTMSSEGESDQSTKFLISTFELEIPYINTNAVYKIFIDIETKDQPFRKFQGVYTLKGMQAEHVQNLDIDSDLDDKYRSILAEKNKGIRNVFIDFINQLDIKYIYQAIKSKYKIVNNKAIAEKRLDEKEFHPTHLDVTIGSGKIKFSNVKNVPGKCSEDETVVQRTIQYIGKLCFKDFLIGTPEKVKFRVFNEITLPDGKTQYKELFKEDSKKTLYSTDADGCIAWSDSITHKVYNRQIYFKQVLHFISENLNLYGRAKVAVSPWQEAWQFFQDITKLSDSKIRINPAGVKKPKLVINQFKSVNFFSFLLN